MLASHMMGFRQEFTGGFQFDDVAFCQSAQVLPQQLAEHIFERRQPLQIGELYASTCNTSPGTSIMYKQALERLLRDQDIIVRSEEGVTRKHAKYMRDTDWVERNPQVALFSLPREAER